MVQLGKAVPGSGEVPGNVSKKSAKPKKGTKARTKISGSSEASVPVCDANDYTTQDPASGRLKLVQAKMSARIAKSKKTRILDFSTSKAPNAFRFDLVSVPREVYTEEFSGLRELWLTNNRISVLTYELRMLSNITTLGLSGNQLSTLPPDIGALKNLERLFVDRNILASIPPQIGELKKLTELRLDHNHIHHFPAEITGIRSLRKLGMSFNKLVRVPAEVCQLSNLIELDLDNNQIEELPQQLARLRMTLQQLGLANNLLGGKPAFLAKMSVLQIVRLSGNRQPGVSGSIVDPESGQEMLGVNIPVRHDGFRNTNVPGHLACGADYNLSASLFGSELLSSDHRRRLRNRKQMATSAKYAV